MRFACRTRSQMLQLAADVGSQAGDALVRVDPSPTTFNRLQFLLSLKHNARQPTAVKSTIL